MNDAGGENWEKYYDRLMQTLMRNNGSCICKDIFGNVVPRRKNEIGES